MRSSRMQREDRRQGREAERQGGQAGARRTGQAASILAWPCKSSSHECPGALADVIAVAAAAQHGSKRQTHPPPVGVVHHRHPLRHLAAAQLALVAHGCWLLCLAQLGPPAGCGTACPAGVEALRLPDRCSASRISRGVTAGLCRAAPLPASAAWAPRRLGGGHCCFPARDRSLQVFHNV